MPRSRKPLAQSRATPRSHRVAELGIVLSSASVLACVALIVVFVMREALRGLDEAQMPSLSELLLPSGGLDVDAPQLVWQPVGKYPKFNVIPLVFGTLKITLLAMLWSVPLAVGAAVFVSQYAHRARRYLKPAIEMLAGVPSVIVGLLALVLLAGVVQRAFGFTYRLNAFTASLALSVSVVPTIFAVAEDALSAVPQSLKDASLALGARRHQTIVRVVVPAAMPGIVAAVALGFGRAIGETMIVLMASGNAAVVRVFDPGSSARSITATLAAELGEVVRGGTHWRVLFMLGALLLVLSFAVHQAGLFLAARVQRRLGGRP